MAEEVRGWRVQEDALVEVERSHLDVEARLQEWLAADISVLDPGLLVIGREVLTDFGGFIDLLCVNVEGDAVVVELKRDKTPREITAQALDYGSWVSVLSHEQLTNLANEYHEGKFAEAFMRRFGTEVPDTLNTTHRLLVVGASIDESSERIIRYLSESFGVNINAATFNYFRDETGTELLARVFLLEPDDVEARSQRTRKRLPNLTYEQLAEAADQAGVGGLYRTLVGGLERQFKKHTTRSSLAFTAPLDVDRATVISVLPQDSDASHGLHFRVYSPRLQRVLGLADDAAVERLLPSDHSPWAYFPGAGPEGRGFEGHFCSAAEVERFLAEFEAMIPAATR